MPQARFWFVHPNGEYVRIKLNAGQSAEHFFHQRTEEGYQSELTCFHFDGVTVTIQWHSDGVDCDGRLSRDSESTCACADLAGGYFDEHEHVVFPAWKHGDSSQRDYSAEAMGY